MRGEHTVYRTVDSVRRRIIPACAGSTTLEKSSRTSIPGSSPHARGALLHANMQHLRTEDHPRMRGEHAKRRLGQALVLGIIPACAGSTI